MAKQIGWSQESNLLYQISALITRLTQVTAANSGTTGLTSVGLSVPSAFSLANNPLIANGTITITAIGTVSQYIDGTGVLQTFPTIPNGTVTSVAALTIGSTGTDLTSTVATGTTTPVITLNVPDASATARGVITTGAQTIAGDKTFTGVLRPTVTTNRQTASYTLVLTDRGKLLEMNVATANNVTIPLDSAVAFPIGAQLEVAQYGAGQTTIVATGGVTIRSASGNLKIASQYVAISLIKIGTNEWYCFGNLSA